jgi:hypothetical protein
MLDGEEGWARLLTSVGKRETRGLGPYAKTRRRVPAVSGFRLLKLLSRLE